MPTVTYQSAQGKQTKNFKYDRKGMASAKKFARETGGKMESKLRKEIKSRYQK
jgi:hypothetical protein